MIPQHTQYGIDSYVTDKIPPGGFLYAVLSNNLFEAMMKADDINQSRMHDICSYIYNNTPANCWGSPEIVKEWLESRG